jgi:hypothetical protein
MRKLRFAYYLTVMLHNLIYAATLSSLLILSAYLIYIIVNSIGFRTIASPNWLVRFLILFVGCYLLVFYRYYLNTKNSNISLEDHLLLQNFLVRKSNIEELRKFLQVHYFNIVSGSDDGVIGSRKIGKLICREQRVKFKIKRDFTEVEIQILNTFYPIDYFLNNRQLRDVMLVYFK